MIEISLFTLSAYSSLGMLFALAFCGKRLPANSSIGLRLILLPGAFALWPYLLFRWSKVRNDTPAATSA